MKLTCAIIDDEEEARMGLSLLLQQDEDVKLVAICSDGIDAIKQLNSAQPDLLFLDIQMPGANGFEVLNSISYQPTGVIFVTAYDQFALKAFEVHALDYLLKPFSDDRFFEALEHAKQKIVSSGKAQTPGVLKGQIESILKEQKPNDQFLDTEENDKLIVKADGRLNFVSFDDIIWVEAYDYYVKIHMTSDTLLVRESMKKLFSRLSHNFVRVHRSSIVNIDFVKLIEPQPNNEQKLTLSNGDVVKVSRSYKSDLSRVIENRI